MRKFTDENTSGFVESEIDEMNIELETRLKSDELVGFPEDEREQEISERILNRF
jgi:predicted DNA-binding transcriptional regulator AlpA